MGAIATYLRDIGQSLWTVAKGMKVTWDRLFAPGVTLQYPAERWPMPERARGRLFNRIEDCIGCGKCAAACPTDCIFIETERREKDEPDVFASDGTPIKLRTFRFDIDMTLCCYCALCTYPCPTHCLTMTPEYEYSSYNKAGLLYRFAGERPRASWTEEETRSRTLSPEELARREEERKRKAEEAKARAAAARKAAAPPPARPPSEPEEKP
jgi:formate hydrogenlyase subunit 6/NADH:ubiquinone oxidoreductase subunit I